MEYGELRRRLLDFFGAHPGASSIDAAATVRAPKPAVYAAISVLCRTRRLARAGVRSRYRYTVLDSSDSEAVRSRMAAATGSATAPVDIPLLVAALRPREPSNVAIGRYTGGPMIGSGRPLLVFKVR